MHTNYPKRNETIDSNVITSYKTFINSCCEMIQHVEIKILLLPSVGFRYACYISTQTAIDLLLHVDVIFATQDLPNSTTYSSISTGSYYETKNNVQYIIKYYGHYRDDFILHVQKHLMYAAGRFNVPVQFLMFHRDFSQTDGGASVTTCSYGVDGVTAVTDSLNRYMLLIEELSEEEFTNKADVIFEKYDVHLLND